MVQFMRLQHLCGPKRSAIRLEKLSGSGLDRWEVDWVDVTQERRQRPRIGDVRQRYCRVQYAHWTGQRRPVETNLIVFTTRHAPTPAIIILPSHLQLGCDASVRDRHLGSVDNIWHESSRQTQIALRTTLPIEVRAFVFRAGLRIPDAKPVDVCGRTDSRLPSGCQADL